MTKTVRVRFAPSPTGALHIGGARTAYFNWLFARQNEGSFVLRIDDTDKARSTEESYRQILESFRWLGIDWDEGPDIGGPYGPYRQSERLSLYRQYLNQLIAEDKVYPCFCSPEQLAQDREQMQKQGLAPRYVGRCRELSKAEQQARLQNGDPHVYRLRTPSEGETVVHDLIRGTVSFANRELDDFIVWKADDTPTYHFASCVDDMTMRITHVIRAEEHLSNTPRHIVLLQALGAEVPVFAHVPMILAPDRSKLSKRHGATSVEEFREQGILPEALVNYLLLLGFAPGDDVELVDREEALKRFDLRRVTKHAAIYDVKKLEWMNAQYMRRLSPDVVLNKVWPVLLERGWVQADMNEQALSWVRTVIQAVQARARSLPNLIESMSYFFVADFSYDEKGVKKHFANVETAERLEQAARALEGVHPFWVTEIEACYRQLIADWGIKGGQLIHPTRLAITGVTVGPGLFDVMALLGKPECQRRMRTAAEWIRRHNA
ncbi:MAG: glutamate--tRNA ligase [Alicyclobacillus macrosporangiidus]|uniref:glutamate--tRNA ligase n=1 Tax=Alicyclobacillus macrosporangiidus TaxID=392015 RepID=UPI0026F25FAD|nr:glutamate--tRNA ligase [Alicyclobacillus macrosporangiidus]MCL6597852.1 glutamate--tRNA ligase [Alicyclobacillus macrosporangiidus]